MALSNSKRRTARFVFGGLLTSSLFACNALLGISDYDRGECSGGGICTSVPTEAGPPTDAGKDTSTDAPIIVTDAAGSRPVSWAHFLMPNYAQDGGPTDNSPQSYEPATDGFRDKVTDLVWREPIAIPHRGSKSWDEAKASCNALGNGKDDKWRLPSRIELVTLLDLSRTPTIDHAFGSTEQIEYWTLSEVRLSGGAATNDHWTVDFGKGSVGKKSINGGTAGVRCIKDQQ